MCGNLTLISIFWSFPKLLPKYIIEEHVCVCYNIEVFFNWNKVKAKQSLHKVLDMIFRISVDKLECFTQKLCFQ